MRRRSLGIETDMGESVQADAEGATAPETLRLKDRDGMTTTLESGASAPAEGITISGERTEGASVAAICGC
jgi:hypothetical protein